MSFARHALLVALALVPAMTVAARAGETRIFATDGIAISGYDAVIYITESRAAKGSLDYALKWHGATWLFLNAATMEAFEMNPKAYAPQYGGYCAQAVADGRLVASAPEAFSVFEGKLYLNSSLAVRDAWQSDAPARIRSADRNWPGILGR